MQQQWEVSSGRSEGVTLTSVEDDFLLNHFLLLVVGKPGSGKSHIVKELATSYKYYKGKFDQVVVISPSVEKLGIPVKKGLSNSVYDLTWLYKQIISFNQTEIKRFERCLKSRGVKDEIPFIAQSVIEESLSTSMKNNLMQKETTEALPPEYLHLNKNE